ncbi:hypothetical protein KQ874_00880 [Mycoplasma sp. ES3157-GEN-MYC]|nr:hypothetical protein [Mycoplasma miroungigenitalium]MBU4690250.1 hypothetical protein [Mycoplasma miroungigenitalium]MBU4691517.1 hypothetical protein [Mycoplasma miroungigenitalium]
MFKIKIGESFTAKFIPNSKDSYINDKNCGLNQKSKEHKYENSIKGVNKIIHIIPKRLIDLLNFILNGSVKTKIKNETKKYLKKTFFRSLNIFKLLINIIMDVTEYVKINE